MKLIQSMHVNCRLQLNRMKLSVPKLNGHLASESIQGVHGESARNARHSQMTVENELFAYA